MTPGASHATPEDDPVGQRLERTIMDLLAARRPGATLCPSEAARALAPDGEWRELMGPAREAAGRLVRSGEVEITQKGEVVDLGSTTGPIRIRKRR